MSQTAYQCQQCGASDSDPGRLPPAPIALICWRCRAGRGMAPEDQLASGKGMLAVRPPGS